MARRRSRRSGSSPSRAIWTGAISFGLVNVPVRMYAAIDEHDLRFHLLHTKDDAPIGYEKVCKKEAREVPDDEIQKAYEVSEGTFVYVTDEDFEAAAGPRYRTIDLTDFVPSEEIDPIYFERSFYLGPADGAEKVYALLARALERSGLVGLGMFFMRDRQRLGCVRVRDGVLVLSRMHFADEVRPVKGLRPSAARVGSRELAMAEELIDRFSGSFRIEKYRDEYRDALLAVIEARERGEAVEVAEAESEEEQPTDLLAALRASVEQHSRGRRSSSRRDGRRGSGGNGLSGLTRDELAARARRRGVRGFSKMSKQDLVAALERS